MGDPIQPGEAVVRDPELEANLTRLLSIQGPLGTLRVLDIVVPVVSLGDVVQSTIQVVQPAYSSTNVFSNGLFVAPANGTVLAATGPLAAGTYDMMIQMAATEVTVDGNFQLQHRNAGNTATLMEVRYPCSGSNNAGPMPWSFVFGYVLAFNESFRILNETAGSLATRWAANIWAVRR